MKFADPWLMKYLVAAFAVWMVATIVLGRRGARRYAMVSSIDRVFVPCSAGWAVRLRPWVLRLRWIAVGLLLLALARPIGSKGQKTIATDGLHILLAIDTSGSMAALDLDPDLPVPNRRTRLEVVRDVVSRFITARVNDAVGLVVFGTNSYTAAPLTLDHALVSSQVEHLTIGMVGDATALGDALVTSVKRLKDDQAKSRIVILLTDGRNTAGTVTPEKAAEVAKAYGVKIYTVGAATDGEAPYIVDGLFGATIQTRPSDLDEPTLTAIADMTGGKYYRAEDANALAQVYADIDRLEKSAIRAPESHQFDEQYASLVGPALLLVVFETLALATRLRSAP
ncbi:MAG: VWA domain-containing protein [Clostridia bacterium]|nr:VWA domain-containing protein [Deltaproteobacteria bacterium]